MTPWVDTELEVAIADLGRVGPDLTSQVRASIFALPDRRSRDRSARFGLAPAWSAAVAIGVLVLVVIAVSSTRTPAASPGSSSPISSVGSGSPTPAPSSGAQIGKFALTGSMATPRLSQTATRLADGRILVAGGEDHVLTSFGPTKPVAALASAEIYDSAAGTFSPTGSMATARIEAAATLLADGRVLIVGGIGIDNAPIASTEIYDPATGTFRSTGSLGTPRGGPTATLLADGRVLVAGGERGNDAIASAELYDPATGTFSPAGSMTIGRLLPAVTQLADGRALFVGGVGRRGTPQVLASAEIYDPASGTFRLTGSLTSGRWAATATLLAGGKVLVLGGTDLHGPVATAELFDPSSGHFSPTGSMGSARYGQAAILLGDGQVLVAGGLASKGSNQLMSIASVEFYNPATGTFGPAGQMATGRAEPTLSLLADGQVLVIGGARFGQTGLVPLATAELFAWVPASPASLSPTPHPSP